MAEIELNVLTGQCLDRRMDDINLSEKRCWRGRKTETTKMQKSNGNLRLKMRG